MIVWMLKPLSVKLHPSILEKANASETDMIIAVTRNDEINMLICQIAFSIFNIPKKIARIDHKII